MNRLALFRNQRKLDPAASATSPALTSSFTPWQRASKPFALLIATWFGCGYFPIGPGTVGSLAGLLLAVAANHYLGWGRLAFVAGTLVLLAPGIWAATRTAQIMKREDPGLVVVDEVLGQWIALAGATALNWKAFTAAFVLFRTFDIWKPWPIRKLEELPEGTGIVMDDLAAGLYAAVILYIGGSWKLY